MDYRDKSIHKLLISMTDSYKKASTNDSRYYQKESTIIRFSDHYSEHESVDFEIVRLSNGCYYFVDKVFGINSCLYKEDILGFLKSYFNVRDLFVDKIKGLRDSLNKTNRELCKAHNELKSSKLRSDLEVADAIYEENKSLKEQLKAVKVELNNLKDIKKKLNCVRGNLMSSNSAFKKVLNIIENTINTIKTS